MGQADSCGCFEKALGQQEDNEARERIIALQRGQKFMRSAFLGMTQREVFVNLSEDTSKIQYKSNKTTWQAEEKGEIDLTMDVKTVKVTGSSGLQFIGANGDKAIFEIVAEEASVRDQWVIALNDLLQDWVLHPEKKPKSSLSAEGTSNKAEYFRKREEEIKERENKAKEIKQKYAAGGMKYTAIALASRPG